LCTGWPTAAPPPPPPPPPPPRVLELAAPTSPGLLRAATQVAKSAVFGFLDVAAANNKAQKEKQAKQEEKLKAEAKLRKKNFFKKK
jgi:hypothetical protein